MPRSSRICCAGEGITVLINKGFRFEARGASFWLCGVDDLTLAKTDIKAALKDSRADGNENFAGAQPENSVSRGAARCGFDAERTHATADRSNSATMKIKSYRRAGFRVVCIAAKTRRFISRAALDTVVVPVRYHCRPEVTLIELRSAE